MDDGGRTGLREVGLKPHRVNSLHAALNMLSLWRFDVVLLDASGFEDRIARMLQQIAKADVPIILLSDSCADDVVIESMEHGATEVVPRSISASLLALRLKRLAHRSEHSRADAPVELRLGPMVLDIRRSTVWVFGVLLDLTTRQFDVLLALASSAGEVVHRHTLLELMGYRRSGQSRSVDMHICKIREKLRSLAPSGVRISTVPGQGYRLMVEEMQFSSGRTMRAA
jgi:two-component system OmpR family response regulator/two-component system response regulator RstA